MKPTDRTSPKEEDIIDDDDQFVFGNDRVQNEVRQIKAFFREADRIVNKDGFIYADGHWQKEAQQVVGRFLEISTKNWGSIVDAKGNINTVAFDETLKQWQRDNNLMDDGIAGRATLKRMKLNLPILQVQFREAAVRELPNELERMKSKQSIALARIEEQEAEQTLRGRLWAKLNPSQLTKKYPDLVCLLPDLEQAKETGTPTFQALMVKISGLLKRDGVELSKSNKLNCGPMMAPYNDKSKTIAKGHDDRTRS